MLPFVPPIQTADLAPTLGTIGTRPEDFIVDEIPLYPASGSGEHLYVKLRKRELATPDLLRVVSRATRIKERDIGCAGMKDKHAITTQWLSFPKGCSEPSTWELPESVEVVEHTRHANKLRTGHLFGNHFKVRLVNLAPGFETRAAAIALRLRAEGLVNYFGSQRFGINGRNLAAAMNVLFRQASTEEQDRDASARGGSRRFYAKFNPSVVQSEIFNRYAEQRVRLGKGQIFAGETVRLEGSPKTFIVEDEALERVRLLAGQLHLTGPIFGSGSRLPSGRTGELVTETLTALGLTHEHIKSFGRDARGSVRDLFVPLTDLTLSTDSAPPVDATRTPAIHQPTLLLEFTLPAGSYATQLIREFTHSDFFTGQRQVPTTREPSENAEG